MNEINLQWLVFGNFIALAFASLAYGFGGMSNGRALRRFISPLIVFLSIVVTSLILHKFSFLILIALPLLIVRNILGYGGDNVGMRLLKRGLIVALAILTGALLAYAFQGGWWLLLVLGLSSSGTILFARYNPLIARAEESLVFLLLNSCLMMFPFLSH